MQLHGDLTVHGLDRDPNEEDRHRERKLKLTKDGDNYCFSKGQFRRVSQRESPYGLEVTLAQKAIP